MFGDDRGVAPGHFEHRIRHIHPDDFTLGTHYLTGDETDFASARTQVENGLSLLQVAAWIAAAVILFDDLGRNGLKILWILTYGATQLGFRSFGGSRVTRFDRRFGTDGLGVLHNLFLYMKLTPRSEGNIECGVGEGVRELAERWAEK